MNTSNQKDLTQTQYENAGERDSIFTNVISDFAEYQREKNTQQNKHKNAFFWIVCVCFAVVVIGSVAAMILIALKKDITVNDLGVVLGSVASLISVIIVLPSKIADNLFPAEGERDFTNFFITAHREDISVKYASDDTLSEKELYDKYKRAEADAEEQEDTVQT